MHIHHGHAHSARDPAHNSCPNHYDPSHSARDHVIRMPPAQALLPSHTGLRPLSRLALDGAAERSAVEVAVLLAAGTAAACCVHFLDFNLRWPGHAILRTIVPVTLGFAVAPRRFAGAAMSLSAAATTAILWTLGFERAGLGAMTSLLLCGPVFDAALWKARTGGSVYLRSALAGVVVNLMAFAVRAGDKVIVERAVRGMGTGGGGGRGGGGGAGRMAAEAARWWQAALPSYIVCGLLAGLVMAVVLFRRKPRKTPGAES